MFFILLVFCCLPFGFVLWYCLNYLFESIIQFPEPKRPEKTKKTFKFFKKSELLTCEKEKEEALIKNPLKKKNLKLVEQMTFDEQDQNRNKNLKIINMFLVEALSNENIIYSVSSEGFSDLQLLGNPPQKEEIVLTLRFRENIEGKKDFNDFISDSLSVKRFEISVRERLSKTFNIPIEEIAIYQIQKGSIQLITILPNQLYSNMNQTDKDDNLVRLREKVEAEFQANMPDLYISTSTKNVRLTQKFGLKPSDFDSRGDRAFSGQNQVRGGRNYIQPKQGWVRYGLRVKGIYEDDDWLKMDGTTGGWAVGFHGSSAMVNNAMPCGTLLKIFCQSNVNINTITKTNIILAGGANKYGGSISNPAAGYKAAVYFSWDIENCYKQRIAINGKKYELAFQCRVNPQHLYDIDGSWFVTDASIWVRPYGIVMKQV